MNTEFDANNSPDLEPKDEPILGESSGEVQPAASPETPLEGETQAGEYPYPGSYGVPPSLPTTPPRRKLLPLIIGVLVIFLVVIGAIVTVVLLTRKDTAINAVPVDAPFYMGVNLLELTPQKINRLLKPLLGDLSTAKFNDADGMFTDLDSTMLSDYGVSFSDDIRSWLGQYAGVSLGGDFGELLYDTDTLYFTAIVETRNKSAADAFLEKLRLGLENRGYVFDSQDYQGITMYFSLEDELAFTRSKGLVLFSNKVQGIQAAIDAQSGDSLAKNADYKALIKQLPSNRGITFYVGGEQYQKLLDQMGGSGLMEGASLISPNQSTQMMKGFAGSAAITDEGLRIDVLSLLDSEKMTDTYKTYLGNAEQAARVAEVLPAETMMMIAGYGLSDSMRLYEEALEAEMAEDYAYSLQMLEQELGINVKTDLVDYLDLEYGMAILPDQEGILSSMAGVPLNLLLFSHHNNQEMLAGTMGKLSAQVENMGLTISSSEAGENYYYVASEPYTGDILTAGLSKAYLALSLSRSAVDSVLNPTETLASTSEYKTVWSHFPKGTTPIFYLELANLAAYLTENVSELASEDFKETMSVFNAIPYVVSGATPVKDNVAHSILIVYIEQPPEE